MFDFGLDYCKFVGSDFLVLNVKDKAVNRSGSVVVSLRDKRVVRFAHELPERLRNLAPPQNRKYFYPSHLTKTKDISVTENEIAIMEGGFSSVKGKHKFWVSLFRGNEVARDPVNYLKHRWTPVACTYSPEAGICASADKFGEIHVWSARNGNGISIFKPINQNLYHVEWLPDETGVYLASKFFTSRSEKIFSLNQYGPINEAFYFDDSRLVTANLGYTGSYDTDLTTFDRATNQRYQLTLINHKDIGLRTASGAIENLFQRERELNARQKIVVDKWGVPSCLRFLDANVHGRLAFVMGTDNGSLLQFSIQSINGQNRLKLQRSFISHEAQISSVSVSPTGKLLASASLDGTVRIWQMSPARTLADVDFYTDGTRIIFLQPNGSSLRAGLRIGDYVREFDGAPYYERIQKIQRGEYQPGDSVTLAVSRMAPSAAGVTEEPLEVQVELIAAEDVQEPLLNLFLTKKDNWITWTRNGFYNSSPQGGRHVGWHVNQGREKAAEFALVSQFQQQLYRPDLVEKVASTWTEVDDNAAIATKIGSGAQNAYSVLEMTPNTAEKYEKIRPPKVLIQSPFGTTESEEDSVKVEFDVQSPNHLPITELLIFSNGRQQRIQPEEVKQERRDGTATASYVTTLPLSPGDNNIVIRARHAAASSNNAEVNVVRLAEQKNSDLPMLYILAVGISKYADEDFDLSYADNDAEDFAKAWEGQVGKMYRDVKSRVVTNENATVDGIEDGFSWLKSQQFNHDDVVFVFFAGHALFDDNDIWVFGSTDLDAKKLTRTGITDDRVSRLLEKELKDAGTVVAFLDTCHAGGVKGKTRGGKRLNSYHSQGRDIWLNCQKRVLASCTQKEVSVEREEWENGAFTEGLMQTLTCQDCDFDRDGFISIEELHIRTRQFVLEMTKGHQTPTQTGQSINFGVTNLARAVTRK